MESKSILSNEIAESIVETMREALLVLDEAFDIVAANRSFYRTFQTRPEDTIGKNVYELGNRQWDIPKLHLLLEDILPSNGQFEDYEVEQEFQHLGRRTMLLNARRLQGKNGRPNFILLAIEDISDRKEAETSQQQSDERFKHISHLITDYAYAFSVAEDGTTMNSAKIDLVICDLGLPRLEGTEVARKMREINPSASVVIASGFIDPAVRSELQALGVLEFIQKPYRPDTMLLTIRHVLDARRP